MNQTIDQIISTKLLEQDINIPAHCLERIVETIQALPEKQRIRRHRSIRLAVAVAVLCVLLSSVTVFAAIDYVRQRMESLSEEEKDSYYEGLQSSPANADSYSRELGDRENQRMEELRAKYEGGTYPAKKLTVVKTQADAKEDTGLYFVEDTSLFVLPSRDLTDEEILEMIDFYYARDYSLNEKVKQAPVTDNSEEFIQKGGMDKQKAIELAKADIGKAYGLDCEGWEASAQYNDIGDSGNVYAVILADHKTETSLTAFVDADTALVTEIFNTSQSSYISKKIKVDQGKFTNEYQNALELLTSWKGKDLSIIKATCEYNYTKEDYLEYGIVNYLFETEDGTGYIFKYSCENKCFFDLLMMDYNGYRQMVDQNTEKKQGQGIERKIIKMK